MSLQTGTTIGVYEVTGHLGTGGMGEVYRARDTKLDREVALKVLPDAFTKDPDRLARFEREAKVLASLNHPNIGGIYGLEDSHSTSSGQAGRALVLELVDGPTLADRIAQGPIPLDDALSIATQIAEALEAAHEQGVIHRDLKPANVKVKTDGTVKVLDFGLAKAFQPDASDPSVSMSPTMSLTAAATQIGMIVGTAAYMAPEQAAGKAVDKRCDIWAFGVVLHEMLTGQRLFGGEDVSHTLAYVLTREIDWGSLAGDTPDTLRRLLRRCLERDPRKRMRDIGEARIALNEAEAEEEPQGSAETPHTDRVVAPELRRWQRPVVIAGVLVALAVGAVGSRLFWTPALPSPEPKRFTVTLPDSDTLPAGTGELLALSPDGRTLVYAGTHDGVPQLFRRPIDQFEATPMPGTEGGGAPFFSPDGQWVGFDIGQQLSKVAMAGGPPQTLVEDASMRGADWGADDLIVYGVNAPGGGLMQIPAAGGEPTPLFTSEDQRRSWYPQVLPESNAVLFTLADASTVNVGELHLLQLDTGAHRTLLPNAVAGRLLSTGHLVFVRSGALWAVPFDRTSLAIAGTPVPVVEGVRVEGGGAVQYGTADDGSLVYIPGPTATGLRSLVWVDRGGEEEVLTLSARDYQGLSLSPDGTRAAVIAGQDGGNTDVWVSELARGTLTRLTSQPGVDTYPLWSPDGQHVVFVSIEGGRPTVYRRVADGSGTPERLLTDETTIEFVPSDWSPDGETLFLTALSPEADGDIGMVSSDGSGTWEPLLQTSANERSPAISPDGRWLAYDSDESGRFEVYVQRFPEILGRQQVSVGGGHRPRWSEDGRELFYLRAPAGPPTAVARVTVETTDSDPPVLAFGEEALLFDWRYYSPNSAARQWDLHPDGQRFLMITSGREEVDGSGRAEINVVLDWFEELKARVPIP